MDEGGGHGGGFVPGGSGASATHSDPFPAQHQRNAMSASTSGRRRRTTGVAPNPTAVAVADGPSFFQPPSASGFPPSALPSPSAFPFSSTPTTTTLTLFSTNDYLGLSTHPRVRAAAARAAASLGCGPRASALVPGAYTTAHRELERALARLKGTEDALLFPSGFAANAAAMAALCGDGGEGGAASTVVVFSDELNHASIVDGARLAARGSGNSSSGSPSSQSSPRVKVVVYPHNDVAFLDRALSDERVVPRGARALVVTDSLFSMDGDAADLRALARLRRRHGFLLVIDEAHATLVCGARGGGAAEALLGGAPGGGEGGEGGSVSSSSSFSSSDVDVHVGTLSKAFGAHGGFVACSARVRSLLANAGRPFAFSTALPAPAVAAALAALEVAAFDAAEGRALRARVWGHARRLGEALGVPVSSPIVPLILGGEREALAASGFLLDRGLHVPAIRPPTVPRGTSRLRVSLSAAHRDEDVGRLIEALRELGFGKGGAGGAGGGEAAGRSRL